MDWIVYNAKIATMDEKQPFAAAMAIENGKIAALGEDEQILAKKTEQTKLTDAKGGFVYPGFGDSHMHVLNYGETLTQADLSALDSIEAMIDRVKTFIREKDIPAGTMIYSSGWNQDLFCEGRMPTRYDLDRISTEHPVVLSRICGHCTVVNSKALEVFGITADTPQPFGGMFEIENGQPNGIFHETAQQLVREQRTTTVPMAKQMIKAALDKAAAQGLVAIHSDDFASIPGFGAEDVMQAYHELEQEGRLPVRIFQQCRFSTAEEFKAFLAKGYRYQQGSERYHLGPVKIIADGSLGARTAWLNEPYSDENSTCGVSAIEKEEMQKIISLAQENDWPVAVHAIGDRAMDMVFDCLKTAQDAMPKALKHGIVHCQITNSSQLSRFAEQGVTAYIQPIFLEYDLHIAADRVGQRVNTSYAWKTLAESGALVVSGSDCPVEPLDALKNLYCAVARQDFAGVPEGGWRPEEKLTMQQALTLCTENLAVLEDKQQTRGTLSVGKQADFVMVDHDLLSVLPKELLDTNVCMTAVQGEITYRA